MRLASLDDEYREERLERVCIINHKVTSKSVWRLADAINDVNLPLISSEVESHIDRVCRFAVRGPLQIAMRKHTALSYAAVNGGEAASLHLINLGASVNVQDGKGHLPVHWACIHGLKRLFERCMKDRPDQINAHTPDGLSLLYLATTNERHELMRFLIRAGADVNEYFVNEKPESAGLLSCPVLSGRLSLASARILSESGADFSVQDLMGRTALHIAAINDKRDLYSFLMSIGCNDDLLDHRGRSPAACLKKNLH